METKGLLFKAMLVFYVILIVLFYVIFTRVLKKTELEFNEKKAILVKENLDLRERIDSFQQELRQKDVSLEGLKKEKGLFEERLAMVKQETARIVESYVRQLDSLKEKSVSYKTKLTEIEKSSVTADPVGRIKEALEREGNKEIRKVLEDTLTKIEMIKTGKNINLEPIVVSPQPTPPGGTATPQKSGTVLSLDRANSLVVINLGRKDGVKEGDLCRIMLDADPVAQSEIVSVRYNIAAAYIQDILPGRTLYDIKEGAGVQIVKK